MFRKLIRRTKALVRWSRIQIGRILRFLTHDMWLLNHDDLTRWKGRLVYDTKVVYLMMNTFTDQKINYQVTALAYQSMMSVVPFLAIAFWLTAGVGMSDMLSDFLYANVNNEKLINALMSAANNILATAESGLFGFISMLTFVWILIWLMISVRKVFNNVWKVEKEQNFLKSLGIGFGVLLLSPFVIVLFFSGTVVYSSVLDLIIPGDSFLSEHLKNLLSWTLFAVGAILIMTMMFKWIPGTKVRYRNAFKAAVVSGIGFTAIQFLYLETQVMVAKQSAVYGVLAAIPLFMVWLNLGWTVILYGAELSYAFQHVKEHEDSIKKLDESIEKFRSRSRRRKKEE